MADDPEAFELKSVLPSMDMVAQMTPRERLGFALLLQAPAITRMIDSALDDLPALLSIPITKGLKMKGLTPENLPDQLVTAVMRLPDEQVLSIIEVQKQALEFLTWTPDKGELPGMAPALMDHNGKSEEA